ncbi:SsrA-binding protein SmpB [Carboxylicivirga sp. M1479]|uniref:SsrA-binding protein SmpB n=1 Tax=Carboxylicivirga sp. M1479 TaxID=2594476 RepID=UPI0011774FFE|nr:SsrA-binding protein SmpB [Carboxylicivirga sp. M1479]TRX63012.1 SsrA-binding protein SmpB [Carboxylicivirga sp. M1479]
MSLPTSRLNIRNKRATFDYELIERFSAGVQLVGTEIKSIRLGKASMVDSYCFFVNGELWLKGMRISEYFYGTFNNHQPERERKLLLKKKELQKLERKTKETGLTIVPVKIFFNDRGLVKVEIALAKGKKQHDKRESLKTKDAGREMDRAKKNY